MDNNGKEGQLAMDQYLWWKRVQILSTQIGIIWIIQSSPILANLPYWSQTLHVEVDAMYIKECSMNLISSQCCNQSMDTGILMFDFTLIHVPATRFETRCAYQGDPRGEEKKSFQMMMDWLMKLHSILGYLSLLIGVRTFKEPNPLQSQITSLSISCHL